MAVLTITINGANDAPVISGLTTATPYAENAIQATPAQLFTGGTVADVDNAHFDGGYLRVSGSAAGDQLSVANLGGGAGQIGVSGSTISYGGVVIGTIDATEDGANGAALKISLNANASAAAVNALLAAIRLSTNDQPAASRTFSVTLNDGDAISAAATTVVDITAQNDAPTLTTTSVTGGGAIYTEGGTAVAPFSGTAIGTVETGQSISQIVLTVAGLADGAAETLTVDGVEIALTNGTSGTTATNGIVYAVSVTGDTATITLTRVGDMTAAQAQAVVDGLSYKNGGTGAGLTPGNRVVALTAIKDSGGTANGGADTSVLTASATLSVQRVNHAPTLTTTTSTPSHTEDGAAVSLFSGTTVSIGSGDAAQALTTLTLTVSNVTDGAAEKLIVDGVEIALTNGNSGTTAANGIAYSVSVSGGTATVTLEKTAGLSEAQVQTLVDGLKYSNTSQNPTAATRVVTLTALKDNGGTGGGGADTATLTAHSDVSVVAVNDAPTVTNVTTTAPVLDTGATATPALFSGTTIGTVEAGQSISEIVVTVAGLADGMAETLTVDGVEIALTNGTSGTTATNGIAYAVSVTGDTATVTLTRAGAMTTAQAQGVVDGLTYKNTNAGAAVTPGDRVVTLVSVKDSGGTVNGGADTRTVNVASTVTLRANDAPVVTAPGRSGSTLAQIDLANAISVTDSRGGATYVATVSVASGSLNLDLSGVTVTAGANDSGTVTFSGTKAQINAALATLKYTPAAFGTHSVVVQVQDGGTTHIGGEKTTIATLQVALAEPRDEQSSTSGSTSGSGGRGGDRSGGGGDAGGPQPGLGGDTGTPVITISNLTGVPANAGGGLGGSGQGGGLGSGLGGGFGGAPGAGSGSGGAGLGGGATTSAFGLSPTLSAPGDGGFRVVVVAAPAGGSALGEVVVARPIGTIQVPEGRVSFAIPVDAFAVTRPDSMVTLIATRADGRPLPGWMSFNPATGAFEGTPPPGEKAVSVKVIARDQNGREAAQVIRIEIGPRANQGEGQGDGRAPGGRGADAGQGGDGKPAKSAFVGRPGLASQLAAARSGGEHVGELVKALGKAAAKVA